MEGIDIKYAKHMQSKLDIFRIELRRILPVIKEIEDEFRLKPGENIDLNKIRNNKK